MARSDSNWYPRIGRNVRDTDDDRDRRSSRARIAWSPELVLENTLNGQVRKWQMAGVIDAELDLLYETTVTQGACEQDPGFKERVDALTPETLEALSAASEPGGRPGPIVPDLVGRCFVLMRLRGDAVIGDREHQTTADIAKTMLHRSWHHEKMADYLGLLLEDYLEWAPVNGVNPCVEIVREALGAIEQGYRSYGLEYCCFAAAWKEPEDRDWSAWLRRLPVDDAHRFAVPIALGFHNATVCEPDPAKRLALAERIETLHGLHGCEPEVRRALAGALYNTTVGEPDPARRLAVADRIEALHAQHGREPAVREALAGALFNATVGEPDPAKRLALAERIGMLHARYGYEPEVRRHLADAFYNVTVVEPDAARRVALVDRIETLHDEHGCEPGVREVLAKALFNATAVEPDPAKRLALAERIETLHVQHGQEPGVRAELAEALYNATVGEPDPAKRLALAGRIETLHSQHGGEPRVREALAGALCNAAAIERDPGRRLTLLLRLERLADEYPGEAAINDALARVKASTPTRGRGPRRSWLSRLRRDR